MPEAAVASTIPTPAANVPAQTATGDLASLAARAFADGHSTAAVANDAAKAVTPAPTVATAEGAKGAAAAVPAGAKLPNTVLSDEPVNVPKPGEEAAKVAAEAAKTTQPEAPAYALATPESGRLSKEHVAQVEAFAKSHGMTEAQAKQVLARDDLNVATAFDQAREGLMKDPVLGGANIDKTIQTTKQVLGLLSPEDRKLIANLPIANNVVLHRFCAKIAALLPQEDVSHVSTPGGAPKSVSAGQAMYPSMYDANGNPK